MANKIQSAIKVLHIYKTSLPSSYGGVESFIDTLCKDNAKLGIKNTVISLHPKPQDQPIEMDGYTVYQAKQDLFIASTGFSISAFGKFRKLAKDADIIHYHFPNPFADILHLTSHLPQPSVVTYHSDIIKQKHLLHIYKPLQKHFLKSVDHIVATSPNYVSTSKVLQDYVEKVSVIPIGIDHKILTNTNPERLKYWRERLPKPFFFFVGALRYYKGLHIAVEAAKSTDIQIAIAGANGQEKELKAQAESLGLNNLHFLGFIDDEDKIALLNLCYGFIFPSHLRSEAFGISLLEAAAVGKPLISCEIGTGTTFINSANETGVVIKPNSPLELREAMQYLYEHPNIAIQMGNNARKRSLNLFTSEKQAESYFQLYKKLINKKRNPNINIID